MSGESQVDCVCADDCVLEFGCVAIRDPSGWLLAEALIEPLPFAIVAVASEDPESFEEMIELWPRYRTPVLPEFLSAVPFERVHESRVMEALGADPCFVVVDLCRKRVATGADYPETKSNGLYVVEKSDDEGHEIPIGICLPPWWAMEEHLDPRSAVSGREGASRPQADREFLYGEPMARFVAERLVRFYSDHHEPRPDEKRETNEIPYELLVKIHRDWLMTPHPKIRGRYPRQILHGCHAWTETLAEHQKRRYMAGIELTAAPSDLRSVRSGPVGFNELVTYFDYCREAIGRGWMLLDEHWRNQTSSADRPSLMSIDRLVDSIEQSLAVWIDQPDEDGLTPGFIIACDRRRVPLSADIPIANLPKPAERQHREQCDCPVCEMIQSGRFGPSFEMISGYHLELDDEYAFSIYESHDEWQFNRLLPLDDDDDEILGTDEEPDGTIEASSDSADQPAVVISADARSVTQSYGRPPLSIQDRLLCEIKLACQLAEIIDELQRAGASEIVCSDLNGAFAALRNATNKEFNERLDFDEQLIVLGRKLETTALFFPALIPKVMDFRARLKDVTDQNRLPEPLLPPG